jgi:hypothetical protein
MANVLYKDHLLVWNAEHDPERDQWRPYVIISWKATNGTHQFHQIKGPLTASSKAAFIMAKELGEAWVDKKL